MLEGQHLETAVSARKSENKDMLLLHLYQSKIKDDLNVIERILSNGIHPDWTETLVDHGDLALTTAARN